MPVNNAFCMQTVYYSDGEHIIHMMCAHDALLTLCMYPIHCSHHAHTKHQSHYVCAQCIIHITCIHNTLFTVCIHTEHYSYVCTQYNDHIMYVNRRRKGQMVCVCVGGGGRHLEERRGDKGAAWKQTSSSSSCTHPQPLVAPTPTNIP